MTTIIVTDNPATAHMWALRRGVTDWMWPHDAVPLKRAGQDVLVVWHQTAWSHPRSSELADEFMRRVNHDRPYDSRDIRPPKWVVQSTSKALN